MADEQSPFPGNPGQPDRRRPAPTIDLKATEIASDPPPAAAEAGAKADAERQEAPEENPNAAGTREPAALRRAFWPALGAGVAGAALTLAIVGLVWLATGRDSDTGAADARIAKLEQEVADLAKLPAAPNPDLAARLQKLETQVGTLAAASARTGDPGLASRLTAIDTEIRSLRDMTEALSGRTEDIAAGVADARRRADANTAALAALAQKPAPSVPSAAESANTAALLSALMDRMSALEARASGGDDQAARTAVTAATLAAVVARGAPFAAELKAAQAQAADAKALAPLEPFAATGLPRPNVLARELAGLEPELLTAVAAPPASGGYLDKLKANAGKLFDIRPIDQAPAGDEPSAIIVRAQFKASRGDLDGALMELAKLPAPARAIAQPWIEKAEARVAALAASRKFAADALAALGGP
jgi:hypothetical protein